MNTYITDINQLDLTKIYSYSDYLKWKFKERVELFKGKILKMSPAPNVRHQQISRQLAGYFFSYFSEGKCEFFTAPFDVKILDKKKSTPEKDIFTVVQPDICVICDPAKLDEKGCNGAPDLIVEILSPGNSQKEMHLKFDLYQEAGVLEYWLVFPEQNSVSIFVLENGKYIGIRPFAENMVIESPTFPDMKIKLDKLFN